ncbi:MAG: hypothetical protein WDO19_27430 [Bacteroidota bacterium]
MNYLKNIIFFSISIILVSCGSNKDARLFANTKWQSNEVGYPRNGSPNVIVLTFYEDSMHFDVPSHDILLVADILGGIAGGKQTHYSWNYRVDEEEVVLDPGLTGHSVKFQRSGDSLIYKGKPPIPLEYFSFKKVE